MPSCCRVPCGTEQRVCGERMYVAITTTTSKHFCRIAVGKVKVLTSYCSVVVSTYPASLWICCSRPLIPLTLFAAVLGRCPPFSTLCRAPICLFPSLCLLLAVACFSRVRFVLQAPPSSSCSYGYYFPTYKYTEFQHLVHQYYRQQRSQLKSLRRQL